MENENQAAATESMIAAAADLPAVVANRKYKSTVFGTVFQDKPELLKLYNAVNHSDYTDPEALEIVTLENAVYMSMKNDLAFVIDMHLNLYEHQSTFNPNMPLRDLFYVAKEYQKLMDGASIYASRLLKLPAPRFIVFYNGSEARPEREVLRLSDAYYTKEEEPELELKVTVLNINKGNNRELLAKCKTLREYMQYVDCVRRYTAMPGMTLDKAVTRAVDECIKKGILGDFLRKNKAEAISVSIFEYNEAEEKEKLRRAEYAGGYEDGIAAGIEKGIEKGIAAGREQGIQQGTDLKLISLVCKKLQKGKKPEEIAEDLEEELSCIEKICKAVKEAGTESDPKEILYRLGNDYAKQAMKQ